MTATRNTRVGAYGEGLAARFLSTQRGMAVLDRNWRCAHGELDLVLRDGDVLVVCEVKTRSSAAYGSTLEAVSADKAARLWRLAMLWVEERGIRPSGIRVDVVGVTLGPGQPVCEHFPGIACPDQDPSR